MMFGWWHLLSILVLISMAFLHHHGIIPPTESIEYGEEKIIVRQSNGTAMEFPKKEIDELRVTHAHLEIKQGDSCFCIRIKNCSKKDLMEFRNWLDV